MSDAPLDATGELLRAEALIELRRFDEAVAVLTRAIGIDHNGPRGWCLLAQAQLGLGDHGAALQSTGQAAALAPDLEWTHRLASLALSRLGRHADAVAAAREAVRLDPMSWRGLTRLAQALIPATPDRSEALMTAHRALELAPLVPDTHIALGFVEAAAGHRQAALAAYHKALEIDPDNTVAHNEVARLHLRGGTAASLARAATGFATAVRSDPRASVSRHNLDVAVGVFLARAAGLLLAAAILARGFSYSGTVASRIGPVALLLLPGVFVVRFGWRLTHEVRRYLWRTVVHPRTRLVAVTAEGLTVVLILIGAVAPESVRPHLFDAALAFAVVSLFSPSGARSVRRLGRSGAGSTARQDLPAEPLIGKGVLWLIAGTLACVALVGGVAAFDPTARIGGIVVLLGCGASCGAVVRSIRRRYPPSPGSSSSPP
jgi:tetratricopeptide (TPR) repeat protein